MLNYIKQQGSVNFLWLHWGCKLFNLTPSQALAIGGSAEKIISVNERAEHCIAPKDCIPAMPTRATRLLVSL